MTHLKSWTTCLSLAAALTAQSAWANTPVAVGVDGLLQTTGGGIAADGDYALTFRIYATQLGGAPAWEEGPLVLTVKGGQFQTALGNKVALSAATLGSLPQTWLGVQVGNDPELARRQLQAVPYALRATVSESIDCSGCIGLGQLDPKVLQGYVKASDLGGFAQKTDLSDYVKAASLSKVAATGSYGDLAGTPKLADVATSGAYGDLTGQPSLAKVATSGQYTDLLGLPVLAKTGTACGSGLVMRGIKVDGSYDCVAGGVSADSLPADGLGPVSNGLLKNTFLEVATSTTTPLAIPDFLGAGITDTINVPDFGVAQGLSVAITVTNSDIAKVRVDLFDVSGNKTTVYNGTKTGKKLELNLSSATDPALSAWVGKNPKGIWSINVADLAASGVAKDGNIESWQIAVKTLSTSKVAAYGAFIFMNSATPPVPCNATTFGAAYANTVDKALYLCNGTSWTPISLVQPGTKEAPGLSCKDILTKLPTSKDGVYWLDPDGSGAVQAYCDMTTDGGGWTLAMRFKNDSKLGWSSLYWTDKNLFNDDGAASLDPGVNANAKFSAFLTLSGQTIRGCKGVPSGGQCFQQSTGGLKTLNALFNEGFKSGGPSRGTLVSFWGDDGSQPNCNVSGINNLAATYGGAGTYSGARWGLVGNNEGDCATTDSGWGFGVYGCSDTNKACGAGGQFWQSGTCGGNCTQGTLWVR